MTAGELLEVGRAKLANHDLALELAYVSEMSGGLASDKEVRGCTISSPFVGAATIDPVVGVIVIAVVGSGSGGEFGVIIDGGKDSFSHILCRNTSVSLEMPGGHHTPTACAVQQQQQHRVRTSQRSLPPAHKPT